MKHKQEPWKHTGICQACGKPTKLFVHSECGVLLGGERKKKHDSMRKRYARGHVPKFAYDV